MKKFLIPIFCILGVGLIIFGKVQYDKKIAAAGESLSEIAEQVENSEELDPNIVEMSKNINEVLQKKVLNHIKSNEPITILAMGSQAIATGDAEDLPWPLQLKRKLDTSYGKETFQLEVINFETISTNHLIETNGHYRVASLKPDILIMEPLLLNDNGIVKMEDTLSNVEIIIEAVKEEVPEAFIILQPANPIFQPAFYQEQVESLKQFAKEKDIEYFDHWQSWPEHTDEELKGYLNGTYPNPKGQDVWAKFIKEYFIAH